MLRNIKIISKRYPEIKKVSQDRKAETEDRLNHRTKDHSNHTRSEDNCRNRITINKNHENAAFFNDACELAITHIKIEGELVIQFQLK